MDWGFGLFAVRSIKNQDQAEWEDRAEGWHGSAAQHPSQSAGGETQQVVIHRHYTMTMGQQPQGHATGNKRKGLRLQVP